MSRPGGDPAVPDRRAGGRRGTPAGLLEKLMAAVRPEYRADDLVFDPRDPVFGGPACAVSGCTRPHRKRGLCRSHWQRWRASGRPDLAEFTATAAAGWHGHLPLGSCVIGGCNYGRMARGMCHRHARQWYDAGRPDLAAWQDSTALPPACPPPACRIGYCSLWTQGTSVFCLGHDNRWKGRGRPDVEEFIASCENPGPGQEHIDLRRLPAGLRLEVQYVLQCRGGEQAAKLPPKEVQPLVAALAAAGASSLLEQPEEWWAGRAAPGNGRGWRAFILDARRRVEALAFGAGWDTEYPRDTWRLRNLGTGQPAAVISFAKIPQPWLRELAKRHARWQLATGLAASTAGSGIRAVTRFAGYLAAQPEPPGGLASVDRPLLERYLAVLRAELGGRVCHGQYVGGLNGFLQAIRRHGWDDTLPASAAIFPEDFPDRGARLPRALAAQVMAQVEQPANLGRQDNPAYRLITLILIRCGLRVSSAAGLAFGCLVTDADGAPYLRYWNTKMKREALVPIDDELHRKIGQQQQRVLQRFPAGAPVLFPRPTGNLDGSRPVSRDTYRAALYRWLEDCDIRDEHGQPAHLTPHQWRHTLGTALINKDVPQHVVQKILDHDSPLMTALYARLSDKTVREHWEKARKVDAAGQPVQISPDGPLGDAAWAKQQLSRATQALPNGYCQLPLVKTCPHANSCLTCPMFVTTAEFLPQHHAQRQATLQIISAAEASGHARVAEMNRQVAGNLDKIIATLEAEGPDEKEATAGAS
ncbi:MAG: tyrosine-type recombinase/integrase [Streptosporangiaceae bacterium]